MGAQHTPESIARWAEQQDEDKKPVGAAGHLSPEQKQTIRVAYLETGGCVTYAELGKRCQVLIGRAVNRETVASCMKGPEYDKLRKHFDTEIKASAVERLKAGILPAADAWVRSVGVAAEKGDHKPAKDLLMHTGTIEPLDDDGRARGPLVLVMVDSMPGQRGYIPPALPPAIEAEVFPNGRGALDAPPTGERLWSDGTRTYTREERAELHRTYKGDIVQIGLDESDVTIDLGLPAQPESPEPLYTDGQRTYTETEAKAASKGQGIIYCGHRPGSVLDMGPLGKIVSRADGTTERVYYTQDEVTEISAKRDVMTIGVTLPGLS